MFIIYHLILKYYYVLCFLVLDVFIYMVLVLSKNLNEANKIWNKIVIKINF